MPSQNRRNILLLHGGSSAPATYDSYLQSLNATLWHRYRETSSTAVANSGTAGSALDGVWTPGVGSVGQAGQLGANEAYDFDGANSKVTIAANAAINNLTTLTYALLLKPDSAGESNTGFLISTAAGSGRVFRINSSSLNLRMFLTSNATSADTITANSFLSTGVWQWLFATFDNAGDRLIRIYKGAGGAVTEASYTTQTAMTGTIANGSGDTVIGNRADQALSYDGLLDEALIDDSVFSSAQMLQIVQLSGV